MRPSACEAHGSAARNNDIARNPRALRQVSVRAYIVCVCVYADPLCARAGTQKERVYTFIDAFVRGRRPVAGSRRTAGWSACWTVTCQPLPLYYYYCTPASSALRSACTSRDLRESLLVLPCGRLTVSSVPRLDNTHTHTHTHTRIGTYARARVCVCMCVRVACNAFKIAPSLLHLPRWNCACAVRYAFTSTQPSTGSKKVLGVYCWRN